MIHQVAAEARFKIAHAVRHVRPPCPPEIVPFETIFTGPSDFTPLHKRIWRDSAQSQRAAVPGKCSTIEEEECVRRYGLVAVVSRNKFNLAQRFKNTICGFEQTSISQRHTGATVG